MERSNAEDFITYNLPVFIPATDEFVIESSAFLQQLVQCVSLFSWLSLSFAVQQAENNESIVVKAISLGKLCLEEFDKLTIFPEGFFPDWGVEFLN